MARRAKVKPKINISRKASKLTEEKHVGRETTDWTNVTFLDVAVYETLRHYSYFYDTKEAVKWARTWVKNNRSDADYKFFCKAPDWSVSRTLCGLCRMIENGAKFDKKRMEWLNAQVDLVINKGKDHKAEVTTTHKKSPAEIVKEHTSDFIAEFEEMVDDLVTKKITIKDNKEISPYDLMKAKDIPYVTAKALADYYTPVRKELEAVVNKTDKDLVEAYADMGTRLKNAYLLFLTKIVDDAEMYMNGKKAARKPRAKKVKSATAQVTSLKYQKEDKTSKLVSIDPSKIVGASEAFLFNTKYRTLSYLKSSSKKGFSVKGTTIQDVDLEASYKKTLRKPEEFFKANAKTTKARLKKAVNELKTKSSTTNGRCGADTILFKAY